MHQNVVTVIFNVESEAYQAFTELRNNPHGEGYTLAEASLIKRNGDAIEVAGAIDPVGVTSNDSATGLLVGSIIGILGGPLGVLLGGAVGGIVGSSIDAGDAVDSASMLQVTASKLYEGETAIIALVQEEEPAFDAPFAKYETTIIRHFAADVFDEVEKARDDAEDKANQEEAAERAARKAAKEAEIDAYFDSIEAENKAIVEEITNNAQAQIDAAQAQIKAGIEADKAAEAAEKQA